MLNMNASLTLKSNGFHITSMLRPSLELSFLDSGAAAVIEDNAFGNVVGGKLWGKMDMAVPDFPEGAFRLMLKAHFDLFSESKPTRRASENSSEKTFHFIFRYSVSRSDL